MKTELVLERVFIKGLLAFKLPEDPGLLAELKNTVSVIHKKYGDVARIIISPPYRKRTTGRKSQNAHIWGHIQQIAEETGNDIDDVEAYVKEKAIRRGYPFCQGKLSGKILPVSMTRIDTVQAGYLIDELHQLAAELGIILQE